MTVINIPSSRRELVKTCLEEYTSAYKEGYSKVTYSLGWKEIKIYKDGIYVGDIEHTDGEPVFVVSYNSYPQLSSRFPKDLVNWYFLELEFIVKKLNNFIGSKGTPEI